MLLKQLYKLIMRAENMGTNEMVGLIVVSLGTILGVGITVVKPILEVVKSITELNESIKSLTEKFNAFEVNNNNAHKRIWDHNDEQDEKLQDHEIRIKLIEDRNQ